MANREKYIEVLSKTAKTVKKFSENVPITISLECVEDILELLKEQEPVIPKTKVRYGEYPEIVYRCGECKAVIDRHDKYCRNCGQAVKWNE